MPAPDWSTPRNAVLTYFRTYAMQDWTTLQKSVLWENPADGERVGQLSQAADTMKSSLEIYDLLAQQYPDDALVKEYVKQGRFVFDSMEKMKAESVAKFEKLATDIEEKIDGDTATVIAMKSETMTFQLKKVKDRWLLLPKSLGMPVVPKDEAMRQQMAEAQAMSMRVMELKRQGYAAFVVDLKAHKYATGKEALEAMQKVDQDILKKMFAEQSKGK